MATTINETIYQHTRGDGATYTITIPATTAGNKLVMSSQGGAIPTVRITNSGGTLFNKRITFSTGSFDSTWLDFTCVGGEVSIHVTLNGDRCMSHYIAEVQDLGAFVAANGSPQVSDGVSVDSNKAATLPNAVSVTSKSVLFATFLVQANLDVSPARPFGEFRFRQFGPFGAIKAEGGNQPPGNNDDAHIWMSAVADVNQTSHYPVEESAGDFKARSIYLPGGTVYCSQAVYENANSTNINADPANEIVKENTLPGTHVSNWFLGDLGTSSGICGYTDKLTYNPGDTVNFKVDSGTNAFRVEVFRLGWYGWDAFGARLVTPFITGTPTAQSSPSVDSTLGSTSCAWTTNATWSIPSDTPSGRYYVIFRRTDTGGVFSTTDFTIKGDVTNTAAIISPDFTYNAYNLWGAPGDFGAKNQTWSGRSLYEAGGAINTFSARAYAASFDRPSGTQSTQASTYLFDGEMSLIHFMEAQGYNLSYLSDIDLENDVHILEDAKLVVLNGHHEYLTTNVYDAYRNAKTAGVNFFINSGNTALWKVRFASSDTNKRTMICYKNSGTVDVSSGFTGTGLDPVEYTGTWRDTRAANTDVRFENELTGMWFKVNAAVNITNEVPFSLKTKPCWRNSTSVQALTTGQTFETPFTTFGFELDYLDSSIHQPTNLVKLSSKSFNFGPQGANSAGTIYNNETGTIEVNNIMYRASSGALIVNMGSWRAAHGTSRWIIQTYDVTKTPSVDLQNFLLSILYDLGLQPNTLRSVQPGSDTNVTNPATGAPTGTRNDIAFAYGLQVQAANNSNLLMLFC